LAQTIWTTNTINQFSETIKTRKEFRLADNLPYTFDFKDENKVKIYNGKPLRYDQNGNWINISKRKEVSINDENVFHISETYEKVNLELISKGNSKYQFNPSNTDPSKKSSSKIDFYLKNQSAKMSLNDPGSLNPNGNYDPNNSQGWEKITQIIEFGLYTPIAKETQY